MDGYNDKGLRKGSKGQRRRGSSERKVDKKPLVAICSPFLNFLKPFSIGG